MKKILPLFMAFVILNIVACSNTNSTNDTPQIAINTNIEYKQVTDINNPVTFTLNDFKLDNNTMGGGFTISLNDTSRLSFTNGENIQTISDLNQEISVTLHLNNPILQGNELSASITHSNGDITKVFFVVPDVPNNANAPLTYSLPVNFGSFNLSELPYERAGFEVMRNTDNKIVDVRKTYNKNEIETTGNIEVLGLYNNYNNIIRIYAGEYDNPDYTQYISVQTEDIATKYTNANLNFEIKLSDYSKVDSGFLFLPGNAYNYLLFIDKKGNVRGFYPKNNQMNHISKLINGKFITDNFNSFTITSLQGNNIFQLPYNFIINNQEVSYKGHHDFTLINTGKYAGMYAILVNKSGEQTIEDYIIIININENNGTAELIKEINLKNYLPQISNRFPYKTQPSNDWFHANSIDYNGNDESLIISGRHQGVIKITLPDNNGNIQAGKDDITLKWILTPHIGLSSRDSINVLDKLLTPLDKNRIEITDEQILNGYNAHEDFEWNYSQHSALLRNGNLIMFDNGDGRYNQATNMYIETDGLKKKFSRYVEYKIDEENMTIQQIHSFGKENPEVYSQIMSNVDTLDNGNFYMFSSYQYQTVADKNYSTYTEVNKNNEIVLQMEVRQDNLNTPRDHFTYRMYHINPFDYVNVDFN